MNIDELKTVIEQGTGIPASLLTGETAEENIAQAKALLAYRRESEASRPKSTREQFKEWLNASQGIEEPDTAGAALEEIQEALRVEAGGYPRVPDGGEPAGRLPDPRPAREQFAEWFAGKSAFDPRKDPEGWKNIL